MKIFSKIGIPSSIRGRKMCISLLVVYMHNVHVHIVCRYDRGLVLQAGVYSMVYFIFICAGPQTKFTINATALHIPPSSCK